MARRLPALVLALCTAGCGAPPRPSAVVLIVGDGLGVAQITFARNALHGPSGRLAFEALPVVGLVTEYSASNAVTDSGAAATAFAAAVKTDNRVIGVDPDGRPARTLADLAKQAGWRVGYVTTTRVTHATPAAFYAHHQDRDAECAIAPQLFEQEPDVVLGGGMAWFDPELNTCVVPGETRQDLLAKARGLGYTIWRRGDDLAQPAPDKLLGLFAYGHLAFQLDERALPAERRDPSLRRLTEIALESLGRGGKPFFLLVEGGRIDHAGHDFDAAGVAAETAAFDDAVAAVLAFQKANPGTLVVLTADHATGGLAINEFVDWPSLGRQKASVDTMIGTVCSGVGGEAELREWTGFADLSADVEAICAGTSIYEKRRRLGRILAERNGVTWVPRVDESTSATKGHTGEDVALYAGGPGAERFAGVLDNTDIPRRIAELLGWEGLGVDLDDDAP